jgi:UDP-GlcNAc:undecaprenyl-phosphate GlcNAc-1-phosphate transferase
MVTYVVLFGTAMAATLILTPVIVRTALRVGLVDAPGGRKLHASPVPRLGGVSIALALTVALGVVLAWQASGHAGISPDLSILLPIMTGAVLVFATGLWDDIDALSPAFKLGVQIVATAIVVGSGILVTRVTFLGTTIEFGWMALPVTALWILVVTNAFNLIDGLDGLAAGLVAIAAATCAAVLIARGEEVGAWLLVALVGAVVGFLVYNTHPARIFLGDSGSLLAGFLLAVTAVTGQQKGATAMAAGVPLLIFALPLADTGITIVRRLIGGQRRCAEGAVSRVRALGGIFTADGAHLHHRLMTAGLSHRGTVLLLYLLACAGSAMALLSMEVP